MTHKTYFEFKTVTKQFKKNIFLELEPSLTLECAIKSIPHKIIDSMCKLQINMILQIHTY